MTAEYLLVVTALCRRAGTSADSAARCSYQKDKANGRRIGRPAAMFCLGSARASRANVGAFADIDFVQIGPGEVGEPGTASPTPETGVLPNPINPRHSDFGIPSSLDICYSSFRFGL